MSAVHLAIVVSRNHNDVAAFHEYVDAWIATNARPERMVSGGASGVDTLAARYAHDHDIPLVVYEVD